MEKDPLSRLDFHPSRFRALCPELAQIARKWSGERAGALRKDPLGSMQAMINSIIPVINSYQMRLPLEERPDLKDVAMKMPIKVATIAGLYGCGFNVFCFTPRVRDAVKHTSLDDVRLGDLQFPFPTFYVGFQGTTNIPLGSPNHLIDGAYITGSRNDAAQTVSISVVLTSRRRDIAIRDPDRYILEDEPSYSLRVEGGFGDTFEKALGFAIELGDLTREADLDGVDTFREGVVASQEDARALGIELVAPDVSGHERQADFNRLNLPFARQGISIVLGALCLLTAAPDETSVSDTWADDAPKDLVRKAQASKEFRKRHKAMRELKARGFPTVRKIDLGLNIDAPGRSVPTGERGPVSPHWRKGFYRRQRHGPGNSLVKLVWIPPQIINEHLGAPVIGRRYDVDDSSTTDPTKDQLE